MTPKWCAASTPRPAATRATSTLHSSELASLDRDQLVNNRFIGVVNTPARRGKSLWVLWIALRKRDSGVDAERAEPRAAAALQLVRRHALELLQRLAKR